MAKQVRTTNHWVIENKYGAIELTAKDLVERAKEYFAWSESNPIMRPESNKSNGTTFVVEIPRAFNIPALCLHCGITVPYLKEISKNQANVEYFLVAQWILQVIYAQKFEMAMAGVFNPVLAAKDLKIGDQDSLAKLPAVIKIYSIEGESPALVNDEYEIMLPEKSKEQF